MKHIARKHNNERIPDTYFCWTNGEKFVTGWKYLSLKRLYDQNVDYYTWKDCPSKVMHIIVPNDFNFWGKDNEDS